MGSVMPKVLRDKKTAPHGAAAKMRNDYVAAAGVFNVACVGSSPWLGGAC